MYNVTVIFTIHRELGKCNSDELHKIIESISPDVIFEELPDDLFDWLYDTNQFPNEPPEVKAIKKYLLNHNIKHIPVDIHPSQGLSASYIEFMFSEFKKYDVYKKLDDEGYKMTAQGGFEFLNSKTCAELFERINITERNLLGFMANKDLLLRIYKKFYEEQDKREYRIIETIYDYSNKNQYKQAILLIGSAHRNSIVEKIGRDKTPRRVKIDWTFYDN